MKAIDAGSDKSYWHRYDKAYDAAFANITSVASILEFGVLRGDSIRWLRHTFPSSQIVGVDIVPPRDSWPIHDQIEYRKVDQADSGAIASMFKSLARKYDLVIEDGSHYPRHQRNCLIETLPHMNAGGLYILEDLHTSAAELRRKHLLGGLPPLPGLRRFIGRRLGLGAGWRFPWRNRPHSNCLSLLWGIERARASGVTLSDHQVKQLAQGPYFTEAEIREIDSRIKAIVLYRRATLPLQCYACNGVDFDLARLTCECGTPLYTDDDSMTALIYVH